MTHLFYLCLAVALLSLAGLMASFFDSRGARLTMRRFRAVYRPHPVALEEGGQRPLRRYLAEHVHQLRMQLHVQNSDSVQERVRQAGYPGSLAYESYLVSRFLCPATGVCIGLVLPVHQALFTGILGGGIGYLLPDLLLRKLIRSYREIIRRSLPDAVDLLVICVDAGLGIDQGLLRVGQELALSHPQIAAELLQIHREQRAGKPRMQAWQDLALRLPLPELQSFTSMLAQTERFGTPIARALSNFGNEMRQKRRQQAEEKAAKTTIKIIFPLVLFIFPSIFLVILGPALLSIMRGLSGLGK